MELRARILLVEDEPDIRRFARLALESEGHEVFEADTLQRGLIEAGSRRPDLAIVDLGLPDGDGVDLIRDLRTWSSPLAPASCWRACVRSCGGRPWHQRRPTRC